jgi:hypothetical protein
MPASKTLKKVQKNRDCPESTAPLPKSLISLKIWLTKYKIINMLTKYNYLGKLANKRDCFRTQPLIVQLLSSLLLNGVFDQTKYIK